MAGSQPPPTNFIPGIAEASVKGAPHLVVIVPGMTLDTRTGQYVAREPAYYAGVVGREASSAPPNSGLETALGELTEQKGSRPPKPLYAGR